MLREWRDRIRKWARNAPVPTPAPLTLWGSKIRLRSMGLDDFEALATFAMTPEVNEHVPYPTETREDLLRHVRGTVHAHAMVPRLHYGFVIQKLDTGEVVGDCSLLFDPKDRSAEMGYQVAPGHWGYGYATEATQCMLECARSLGCRRAWTRVYARNTASVRVLEKCDFRVVESYVETLRQGEIQMYRMERMLMDDLSGR
ncbi:MAG: GNAT family N-acetyltransferase [Fimbriimonas sp.]